MAKFSEEFLTQFRLHNMDGTDVVDWSFYFTLIHFRFSCLEEEFLELA